MDGQQRGQMAEQIQEPPVVVVTEDADVGMEMTAEGVPMQASMSNGELNKRRSVACKSCHSLKVRCAPIDANNPLGPCVRCLKAGRQCEIDFSQPRKRKRKTSPLVVDGGSEIAGAGADANGADNAPDAAAGVQVKADPSARRSSKVDQLQKRIKLLEAELSRHVQQPAGGAPQSPTAPKKPQIWSPGGLSAFQPHAPYSLGAFPPPAPPFVASAVPGGNGTAGSGASGSGPAGSGTKTRQFPTLPPFDKVSPVPSPHTFSSAPSPSMVSGVRQPHHLPSPVPFFDTPSNVEITPQDSVSKDGQAEELQNDLDLLMSTQKATLTQLTADVLKTAEKRMALIDDRYGPFRADPVAMGLMTIAEAEDRLKIYRQKMYPIYPFIEIPKDASAEEMRRSHKFLFTTIVCITAAVTSKECPALQNQLEIELCNIKALVTEVLIIGNKNLELLQCLVAMSVWYNSSELFHQRRYHLINSLCISMVHDLGLTGKSFFSYNREEGSVKKMDPMENLNGVEYRRLLLTVYFASISIALFLKRRIQVSWTPYLKECCDVLESTLDPGDLKISTLAKLSRMLERIHCIVHGNNEPTDTAFMAPDRLKQVVWDLQRELSEIKTKIPRDDHLMMSYYYSVQAYLHEPELHKIFTGQEHVTPAVSPLVISSIDKCSRSCVAALEQANLASTHEIAAFPFLYSSRLVYTTGMLLRLRYLVIGIPSLAKATYFPRNSIERVVAVARTLYACSQEFPTNNFLNKMRLVIALFCQTYSTQLKKLSEKKPVNFKWENENDINSLNLLSQAAMAARNEFLAGNGTDDQARAALAAPQTLPSFPPALAFRPAHLQGQSMPQMASQQAAAPAGSAAAGPPAGAPLSQTAVLPPMPQHPQNAKGSQDLEFSYYALNDEFWTELLMNSEQINGQGFNVGADAEFI